MPKQNFKLNRLPNAEKSIPQQNFKLKELTAEKSMPKQNLKFKGLNVGTNKTPN